MVNTGKPSTGCHTCRKRKVKCDERRPGCKRCEAISVTCPGYRATNVTFFRNQSTWAKEKVRKRLGSTSTTASSSSISTSSNSNSPRCFSPLPHQLGPMPNSPLAASFAPNLNVTNSTDIPRCPTVDPAVFAVSRFYSEYVVPKGLIPFLDFLPELYDRPCLDPCFEQALPAVALASASRQLRSQGLMVEAQRRYGQALSGLAVAIKDPARAKSDDIFTAVFLLGMYEIITSDRVTTGIWDTHYQGRLALINLRGKEQLRSKAGRKMFMVMHNQLFINSFVGREPPADDYMDWFFPAPDPTQPGNTVLEYGRTVFQVARVHAKIARAVDEARYSGWFDIPRMVDLIREGMAMDDTLSQAVNRLPHDLDALKQPWVKHWGPGKCSSHPNGHDGLFDPCELDDSRFYSKWTTIFTWNQFRTVRMHLLQVLHEAADHLGHADNLDLPSLTIFWETTSAEMVEDLCATVPGILGGLNDQGQLEARWSTGASLRGYMLLWPLRASIMAIGVPPERRQWIASVLHSIGETLGIGQASALAQLAPFGLQSTPRKLSDLITPHIPWVEAA